MKPRILISGSCGGGMVQLSHDAAEVSIGAVPSTPRLSSYDVTILRYSDFANERPKRVNFDQQCAEALDQERIICFLHHDESTFQAIFNNIGDTKKALQIAHDSMPGFHWLVTTKQSPEAGRKVSPAIVEGKIGQPEFSKYLRHWGVSHNFFVGEFDKKVYWAEANPDAVLGFYVTYRKGLLFYLPFNPSCPDYKDQLITLVGAFAEFLRRRNTDLPDWAQAPFFAEEIALTNQRVAIQKQLEANAAAIQPFAEAKNLLVLRESALENAIPAFITQRFTIATDRLERFMEDFWLLRDGKNRSAICEVKSKDKGFKKSFIYDVYNHREAQGYDESFPAILFVSFNLQETSWDRKEAPISEADCKIAVDNNVLVVRVEDLVRLWDGQRQNKITLEEIIAHLHESRGWLEVTKDHKLVVHGSPIADEAEKSTS